MQWKKNEDNTRGAVGSEGKGEGWLLMISFSMLKFLYKSKACFTKKQKMSR